MGCTASRVANEDTVRRCRERRRLMKEAVLSRHHLAAAHSDYLRSLRLTASALSSFASFHSLLHVVSHHHQTPPVHLQGPTFPHPRPTHVASTPFPRKPAPQEAEPFRSKIEPLHSTASNYAATPSQASSAWDWERFYPPSPPGSEFFDRLERQCQQSVVNEHDQQEGERDGNVHHHHHHLPSEEDDSEDEVSVSPKEAQWVDHRGRASTSTVGWEPNEGEVEPRSGYLRSSSEGGDQLGCSVASGSAKASSLVGEGMEVVAARHRDLKEIAGAIEEWFVRAAAAGEGMTELLENGWEQLDRSFRRLRKTVYHSSSVLSALSSKWTSKPPLSVKYQLDTAALDSGGRESHFSTLERLLAWEKKLYQEVKAREGVKIEHEKKLAALQSQEYKGKDEVKLNKTKAAIQKLQSLILVTSQAVSTTSSAIIKVRDDELAPQLGRICHGFLAMWRSMHRCHEIQNCIVQQVRGLANDSATLESTSDLHRQATCDLESAVVDWHSSFTRLLKFNREYVRSLYGWIKLTRVDVTGDETEKDRYSLLVSSELSGFCDDWKQALDRVPDTVAAEAIHSFVNVVHSISLKQVEEFKIKKQVDHYSKELEKKMLALRSIERRYYQSYSTVGLKLPDKGSDNQLVDARDPLQEKRSEIEVIRRKVGEEMSKHMKAIKAMREMTLNNIQTGLPGVFQAITAFSAVFAEALAGVRHQKAPQMSGD